LTKKEWETTKHFTVNENFGDPFKMDYSLLKRLDALREFVDKPITILCGYATSGHVKNSQHYFGKAVDCYCEDLSLLDFYLAAERFSFNGIGIYPSWAHKGLHLDVRELRKYQPGARWIRVDSEYIKLNSENVRKFVEAPVVA